MASIVLCYFKLSHTYSVNNYHTDFSATDSYFPIYRLQLQGLPALQTNSGLVQLSDVAFVTSDVEGLRRRCE